MDLFSTIKIFLIISVTQNVGSQKLREKKALQILSLLPYPDAHNRELDQPAWQEGTPVYLAAQLAVSLINNRSDILKGYQLELLKRNGGCNILPTTSVSLVESLFYREKQVSGIIGPGCSPAGFFVSKIVSTDRRAVSIPTIHLAGSPKFAKREEFPYSFSMVDHATAAADALLALLQRNRWRSIIILYDESNTYYTTIVEYLQNRLVDETETTIAVASVVYEHHIPFNKIVKSQSRIILLLAGQKMFRIIFCAAFRAGLSYPMYQWVFLNRDLNDLTPINTTYGGRPITCNMTEIHTASNMSILLLYHSKRINRTRTHSGLSQKGFKRRYEKRVKKYNLNTNSTIKPNIYWGSIYFDTAWAMALALNNSIEELETHGLELTMSRYKRNALKKSDIIQKQLLKLSFEGVSGKIKFDEETGFVSRGIDIFQLQRMKMELAIYFNGTDLITPLDSKTKLQIIEDNFDNYGAMIRIPLHVSSLCLFVTLLFTVLLASTHVISLAYRNTPSVKKSNLKIIHTAYFGCYLTVIGIMCGNIGAIVDSPKKQCQLEQASFVLAFCGMTLTFATICARTWRLYRIFVHYKNPGRFITDRALIIFIISCYALQLPATLYWSIADPVQPDIRNDIVSKSTRVYCTNESEIIWFSSLTAYNYIILLLSCYFALRCNKGSSKSFKSNSVVILAYLLAIEQTMGICSFFLLPNSNSLLPKYLTINITLLLYVFLCSGLLFLPPILPLLNGDLRGQYRRLRCH